MSQFLTERQQHVLQAIRDWIKEQGYPPTIRELGKHLGIKSLRGVTTHLDAIAKKGHLQRKRGARGIRLLGESPFDVIEQTIRVPIVGRIAAGTPVLAEEQIDGHLVLDASLLGKAVEYETKHFALRVRGRSMQGAGILNGDYVVVRQQPTVANGEIAAVLIENEATIKRFFKEENRIRLQPDNQAMEPIILEDPQAVTVLGKVIAVFRQLSQ